MALTAVTQHLATFSASADKEDIHWIDDDPWKLPYIQVSRPDCEWQIVGCEPASPCVGKVVVRGRAQALFEHASPVPPFRLVPANQP